MTLTDIIADFERREKVVENLEREIAKLGEGIKKLKEEATMENYDCNNPVLWWTAEDNKKEILPPVRRGLCGKDGAPKCLECEPPDEEDKKSC